MAAWLSGSSPQSSAETAWPGTVCVWSTQLRSGRAMWMALCMTKPARFTWQGFSVIFFPAHIDLAQVGGRDLLVQKPVRIDEDLVLGTRTPQQNMVVQGVRPAMRGDQPVGGGELDAGLPLLLAYALAD